MINVNPAAVEAVITRLSLDWDTAELVAGRDVPTCERALGLIQQRGTAEQAKLMAMYLRFARAKAPSGVYDCDRCPGDGLFYMNSELGPVAKGQCFRCEGKSYQTVADRRRNEFYDSQVMRVSL